VAGALRYLLAQPGDGSYCGGGLVSSLGLVAPTFATIQIDLNVVHANNTGLEVTWCDHNCTVAVDGTPSGGSYTCPAAISLNRGARQTTLAPALKLTNGLGATIDGLYEAQRIFLRDDLNAYLTREGIPAQMHEGFRTALSARGVVVNLFGGSPETHPQVIEIIEYLHDRDAEVHMTTTGRRLLRDVKFRERLLRHPPDVIGLSADDFETIEYLDYLFGLRYEQLSDLWRRVPWQYGQRRKAIEAVQICKLAERVELPPLLFNIVLHPGNVAVAQELHDRLAQYVPDAMLNPYPVQTAFLGQESELTREHIRALHAFTDAAIGVHAARATQEATRWNLVPRIGYWILMKALLGEGHADSEVSSEVGGRDVWRCYGGRGAGRCVQVGIAPQGPSRTEFPGGHLGCFWNTSTITDPRQVWDMTAGEVAAWVLEGRQHAASSARSACSGCLFPRMSMDTVSLELGLSRNVRPRYRSVRRQYLGY
jgi:hypothetical protein